ncbi:PREDICTED: uncharacterized protein LOC108621882 isoform X1 [Drosophila arizonae]|uniref:Uncharacterized protein LOC108621882 isoform X1 n=2 Tax=Drosophila arizonae TaxID=7263 RepID=A0ABM1Q668_DROAR|nr:PREDICTED: uncharacterized protein LOC108621882 isoform X1 [Drosophila arizonae]
MSQHKFKTPVHSALIICMCFSLTVDKSLGAPVSNFDRNLVTYPEAPSEVLPIEPLLIYPETQEFLYQARTAAGDGEQDIIYVKLLPDKLDGYRPKQQRHVEKPQRRKELSIKDIFFVKARANGQFSHERLKVYRLPEFYAITVFRNGEK